MSPTLRTVRRPCIVEGCNGSTRSYSGVCGRHDADPVVCYCTYPEPDRLGQCEICGRRVVTYVDPSLRDTYAHQWPEQWARAIALGLDPRRPNLRRRRRPPP